MGINSVRLMNLMGFICYMGSIFQYILHIMSVGAINLNFGAIIAVFGAIPPPFWCNKKRTYQQLVDKPLSRNLFIS